MLEEVNWPFDNEEKEEEDKEKEKEEGAKYEEELSQKSLSEWNKTHRATLTYEELSQILENFVEYEDDNDVN